MRMNEMRKRILSFAIAVLMLVSAVPLNVFTMTASAVQAPGLCEHHTEHEAACGYLPPYAGSPCTHVHDDLCGYRQGLQGVACDHSHGGEECGEAAVSWPQCTHVCGDGYCSYTPDLPGNDCGHSHDESCGETDENGAYPGCVHTAHDEACGYQEFVSGNPCDHTHGSEICGEMSLSYPACSHVCGTGSCAYVAGVEPAECTHTHDGECGYEHADEGKKCGFVCKACQAVKAAVELYEQLPAASSVTAATGEAERTALSGALAEAGKAYAALKEAYPEDAETFEEDYAELLDNARALNDILTGSIFQRLGIVSYDPSSQDNAAVTVTDAEGSAITGASVTVTRNEDTYEAAETGNGIYEFTRNSTEADAVYTVTVSRAGYQTATVTMQGNSSAAAVTLASDLYTVTVEVKNGIAAPGDASAAVSYGGEYRVAFQAEAGYVLDTVTVDDVQAELETDGTTGETYYEFKAIEANHSIVVTYAPDSWRDAGQTPDPGDTDSSNDGDGIPDTRQAIVEFKADPMGSIEGKALYVLTLPRSEAGYSGSFSADQDQVSAKADPGCKHIGWTLTSTAPAGTAAANAVDPYQALPVQGGTGYTYTAIFDKDMAEVVYPDADKDGDPNDPPDGEPDDVTVEVQVTKSIQVRPNGGSWNGSAQDQTLVIGHDDENLYAPLAEPVREGYAFQGWKRTAGAEDTDTVFIFTAQWAEDTIGPEPGSGDGIPDFKQAVVEFRAAQNGTLTGRTYWVMTLPLTDGSYKGAFDISRTDVSAQGNTGYTLKHWLLGSGTTPVDPYQPMEVEGGGSYLFTAHFQEDYKDVIYPDAALDEDDDNEPDDETVPVQTGKYIEVRPNGGIWRGSILNRELQITDDDTLEAPVRIGYLFMGWRRTAGAEADTAYIFTAQWEKDIVGGKNANGSNIGDGIPDKYQKKVIFRVVNGYWTENSWFDRFTTTGSSGNIVVYLTLVDENGNWDVNGSAKLTVPTGMYAKNGYEGGKWDKTTPETITGTKTEIFTYRFTRKATTGTLPNTGDTITVFVIILVLSGAAIAAIVLFLIRKKKSNNR